MQGTVLVKESGNISQNLCLTWVLRDEQEFAHGKKGQDHFKRENIYEARGVK